MRKFPILMLGMATIQTASAHSLDGDASLAQEIAHQLTGAHHLPLLLMVVVGLAALVLARRGKQRR